MKGRLVAAVTFIAGLYYFLEFLLPPQIGGDFDRARLGTFDVQREGNRFLMWYVGFSDEERSAIGLAISDDGQNWQKWPQHEQFRQPGFDQPFRRAGSRWVLHPVLHRPRG